MVVMRHLKNFHISMATLLLPLLCGVLLAACQKDLCDDHRHGGANLSVRFDWSGEPDAAPATMALTVFADGAQPVQTGFHGREGGEASLSPNTYRLIGFNDDTESLFARGGTWADYEIYAQETVLSRVTRMFQGTRTVPQVRGTEDEPVVFEPDELWTSAREGVTVTANSTQVITMPMESAITDYNFTITNVENLSYAVEVMATLSGMSASWLPAQHRGSDTHCIIPFPLTGDGSSVLRGTVRTFGHCPGEDADHHAEHLLTIYAEMKDGSKIYFTSDVTEQMHDAAHLNPDDGGTGETEVPIVIDQLPLPKPIVNGSGLQPSVAEWQEIRITIQM